MEDYRVLREDRGRRSRYGGQREVSSHSDEQNHLDRETVEVQSRSHHDVVLDHCMVTRGGHGCSSKDHLAHGTVGERGCERTWREVLKVGPKVNLDVNLVQSEDHGCYSEHCHSVELEIYHNYWSVHHYGNRLCTRLCRVLVTDGEVEETFGGMMLILARGGATQERENRHAEAEIYHDSQVSEQLVDYENCGRLENVRHIH